MFNDERGTIMIDFENGSVFKLHLAKNESVEKEILPLLVSDEEVISVYRGVRDHVIFTNRRIIAVNIQGVTGKKRHFTFLPYAKVQAFTMETSGVFDMDSEMTLYFSSVGKITFEFTGRSNITELCQVIGAYIL